MSRMINQQAIDAIFEDDIEAAKKLFLCSDNETKVQCMLEAVCAQRTLMVEMMAEADDQKIYTGPLGAAVARELSNYVALLLPLSDLEYNDSELLVWAVGNTDIDCVKLLLPHCDAKTQNSTALQIAVLNQSLKRPHVNDIAEMLYEVSDAQAAWLDMQSKGYTTDTPAKQYLQQRALAEQERTILNHCVESDRSAPKKKM